MEIVELYSDKPDTIWHNQKTFLCVFDEENNLIADYDFKTGLRLIKSDTELTIYIHDSDLIPGRWVLFVKTMYDEEFLETIKIEGSKNKSEKDEEIYIKENIFKEKRPWDYGYSDQLHVSREEREERLSICKSCPFFNIEDMTCEVDGSIVLNTTKNANLFCPEEKWGDVERIKREHAAHFIEKGEVDPGGNRVDPEEQKMFEEELEEYLKGL
jgi:hypothetical protein